MADLASLPRCAQSCAAADQLVGNSGCQPTDIQCICNNSTIAQELVACLSRTCSQQDAEASLRFFENLCQTVGVTLGLTVGDLGAATSTSPDENPSRSVQSSTPAPSSSSEAEETLTDDNTSFTTAIRTLESSLPESDSASSLISESLSDATTSSSTVNSVSGSPSAGISTGTLIGAISGAVFGTLLLAAIGVFFFLKVRKRKQQGGPSSIFAEQPNLPPPPSELPDNQVAGGEKHELPPGQNRFGSQTAAPATTTTQPTQAYELPAGAAHQWNASNAAELPASNRPWTETAAIE